MNLPVSDPYYGLPATVANLLRRAKHLLRNPPHPQVTPIAIVWLRQAWEEAPDEPAVLTALARALHVHGKDAEAIALCEQALIRRPDAAEIRLEQLLLTNPSVFADTRHAENAREAYAARLADIESRWYGASFEELAQLGLQARRIFPYWLPYHGLNDASLQRRLGALLHSALAAAYPGIEEPVASPPIDGKIRIGIVSNHFRTHTIWNVITRGWLAGLNKRGFACFGYSHGSVEDECTETSRRDCVRFVSGKRTYLDWCEEIRADRLHAILYPALSYSGTIDRLALTRLAPVQCVGLGHCETSGYPTLDYFLSSELMEPDDGDDHYTERLVRLPDLGISYPAAHINPSQRGRNHAGIRADAILYLSPHPQKKYLPWNDDLYARIAEAVPASQLVFFRDPRVWAPSRVMERRLRSAFEARRIDPDQHLVFLDWLNREDYESLLMSSDVYLDVPGWNGGTTTAQALTRHIPMVTLEGHLARSHMGSAMLRYLGISETVAHTPDDYVRIGVRLGQDADWRADIRHRLTLTSHRISDDQARIDGLAAFLERAVCSR